MSHSYLVIFYVYYEVVDPLCDVENFIDHFSLRKQDLPSVNELYIITKQCFW